MKPTGLRVAALAGGVGAARMLRGLCAVVGDRNVTAIVNTGDDTVLHGLYVCPDLDTVTYTLAGANNQATGWGLTGETWSVMEALAAFEPAAGYAAGELTWFSLGDKDLATHLFRTGRLAGGATLSQVSAEVAARFGVQARLLPMSDDRVETRVLTRASLGRGRRFGGLGRGPLPAHGTTGEAPEAPGRGEGTGADNGPGGEVELSFQEYFVGHAHSVSVAALRFAGAATARPAPGALEALREADVVVICPSNPLVSIGPVLAVPGLAEAVAARRASTVAVSPIIAGRALKGPADRMLSELGHEPSALGVARIWAPVAANLVVDEADASLAPRVEAEGMACTVTGTVMTGPAESARLATAALEAALTSTRRAG